MNTTLTLENLTTIKNAMDSIKSIDRSDYFKQFYSEIEQRIHTETITTLYKN